MSVNTKHQLDTIIDKAYRQGFLDATQAYAFEQNGELRVGDKGITLKEAIKNIDDDNFFNPNIARKVVAEYIDGIIKKEHKDKADTVAQIEQMKKHPASNIKYTSAKIPADYRCELDRHGQETLEKLRIIRDKVASAAAKREVQFRIEMIEQYLAGTITPREVLEKIC